MPELLDDGLGPKGRIAAAQAASALSDRETDYIIGVSGNETGYGFRRADQNAKLNATCPRTFVGFERLGGSVHPTAWTDDHIKQYVLKHELASASGTWLPKITKATPAGKVVSAFFEDVVAYRWNKLLRHFSLGPTQMILLFTGIGGLNKAPGRPGSWDEIHAMYIKETRGDLFTRLHKQLGAPPSDDDEACVHWIKTHQTGQDKDGGDSLARSYWFGTGAYSTNGGVKQHRALAVAVRQGKG
jgi:hypothetical protein